MTVTHRHLIAALTAGVLTLAACGSSTPEATPPPAPAAEAPEPSEPEPLGELEQEELEQEELEPMSIQAKIQPKSGSELQGTVKLTSAEDGVKVVVNLSGAEPGKHGVHFHEKADCSAEDATSAGGHFNPGGHDHALPDDKPRHLGDLGNIEVGQDGMGHLEIVREGANLQAGDPLSLIGRGLVVHAKPDDGGQPTGNAGARIGCAEIRAL